MWISATKELPPVGEKVLVYRFRHGVDLGVMTDQFWTGTTAHEWVFTTENEDQDVGFWMTLPKLPVLI